MFIVRVSVRVRVKVWVEGLGFRLDVRVVG